MGTDSQTPTEHAGDPVPDKSGQAAAENEPTLGVRTGTDRFDRPPNDWEQVLAGGGFWGMTLSNVIAGLIVTYIVGGVAAIVALGGRNGAGTSIDWFVVLLFVLVAAVLGFNLTLLAWSGVRLLGGDRVEPVGRALTSWRLAAAATAVTGLMWMPYGPPGWWSLLPTAVTVASGVYAASGPRGTRGVPSSQRPLTRHSARAGLVAGILGSAFMAVWMGVLWSRAVS